MNEDYNIERLTRMFEEQSSYMNCVKSQSFLETIVDDEVFVEDIMIIVYRDASGDLDHDVIIKDPFGNPLRPAANGKYVYEWERDNEEGATLVKCLAFTRSNIED